MKTTTRREFMISAAAFSSVAFLCGCSKKENGLETPASNAEAASARVELAPGEYSVDFKSDSPMFRLNETCGGKATLVVAEDGSAALRLVMPSKNTLKLYVGKAERAQADAAMQIEPTVEKVVYPDGEEEEVHVFCASLPLLDAEFDLARIGAKGKWYDHKVCVSNPQLLSPEAVEIAQGEYLCPVVLEGGSGRGGVTSPALVRYNGEKFAATLEWSSPYYDYMLVGEKKYTPVNKDGNSVFEVEFDDLGAPVDVVVDTVKMGAPHEIEYKLTFDWKNAVARTNEETEGGDEN